MGVGRAMGEDGEGKKEKGSEKAKKLDTSFKKAVGGSLKLKGVEFKGKKAIVTKKPGDKGGKEDTNEYLAPGGVKKVSNSVVSGRSVGGMSYNPQARLLPLPSCLTRSSPVLAGTLSVPDPASESATAGPRTGICRCLLAASPPNEWLEED